MFKIALKVLWSMLVDRQRMAGRTWWTEFSCRVGRMLFAIGAQIPVASFRKMMAKVQIKDPITKKVVMRWSEIAGINCLYLRPNTLGESDSPKHVLLYLHGGGYVVGHPDAYQALMSNIAVAKNALAIAPDYRLSPENPFPAGQDDCLAVAKAVREAYPDARLTVMGDSAGGGLSVATALSFSDIDNLVLLSPWVEPNATTGSIVSNVTNDIFLPEFLLESYQAHIQNADSFDTRVNFKYADLSPLPRTLLQVAGGELFYDQGVEFAERAKCEGVEMTLDVYETQFHVFQVLGPKLNDTKIAIGRIVDFIE